MAGRERTTSDVFDDHLRLRNEGDLETDLTRNYSPDVVLLTGIGVFRGHDGVRASADILRGYARGTHYDYRVRLVEGEIAYLEWRADSAHARIDDGADSFLIRDGRIQIQTIHYTPIADRTTTESPDGASGTEIAAENRP